MKQNSSKKKVLFRLRSLEMGGVVKVLIDILENLSKDQLDISVMVNLYQGELRNQIPKDIQLIQICKGKEDLSQNPFIQKIQLAYRLVKLKVLGTFPYILEKVYYKKEYDVEIAFGRAELEMVLNSPQKNSKKIAWVHWDLSNDPTTKQLEMLKRFDHLVFCSDNVRAVIKSLHGIAFPNSSVIHNVIHPEFIIAKSKEEVNDKPHFDDSIFTFSSVGRVKNGKGYPLLLDVHKKLIDQGLGHRIIIVGDGEKLEELRERAKELGMSDTFVLLGNKINPFPYIVDSDFFILPTQSEAYPLSIKEALVLGIPLLVSDVGGVNEILSDQIDGLLMSYDEKDLFEKMKMILTDESLVNRLKMGAVIAKDKFETEEIYNKIEKLLTNSNYEY